MHRYRRFSCGLTADAARLAEKTRSATPFVSRDSHPATLHQFAWHSKMNGIDVRRWLEAWLAACAANGGQPPDDLSPWLPWTMSEERRRDLMALG